jgi:hypothetical protein
MTAQEILAEIKPDADLDLAQLKELVQRVQETIHSAPNTARRQMNNFVIEVGTYVRPLTQFALQTAEKIGPSTWTSATQPARSRSLPTTFKRRKSAAPSARSARPSSADPH